MSQIFISYRREGGEALGRLIYEKLTDLGYSVFFDTESMQSEVFSVRLYDEIEKCSDFILILPRGGLDRCIENEDDWVRLEIRHALKLNKHIIPIIMRNFSFPQNLPDDIKDVSTHHGVPFETMDFFDARIQRLCEFIRAVPAPLTPPTPPKPPKKPNWFVKFIKFIAGKIGAFFLTLWHIIEKIFRGLWCFGIIRYTVVMILGFMILFFGIEVIRDVNNTNVDQWIKPKYLFEDNVHMNTLTISKDNALLAVYNGDGKIELRQALGNVDAVQTVGVLETSFVDKRISLGFSDDSNYCYAICDGKMEVFNTHTEEKIDVYTFPDYDSMYYTYNLFTDNVQNRYTVLWADKEDAGLKKCSIYKSQDGVLALETSFDITGYSFLGTAADGQYILMISSRQEMQIIDVKNSCVAENTLEVLKEKCCGNIDVNDETRAYFDETGRYFMYTINKESDDGIIYDVIIKDMQTGKDVFSRSYLNMSYFTFDRDGTFIIFYSKKDAYGYFSEELHRVNYLSPGEMEEVLITDAEIRDMVSDVGWFDVPHDVYVFEDTDTMLLAYNNRLQLIDLDKKIRTASCNSLVNNADSICFYLFFEMDSNVVVWVHNWQKEMEENWETYWDYRNSFATTAVRFSFEKDGDDIIINENAYADSAVKDKVTHIVMFVLSTAATIAFFHVGKQKEKTKTQ